MGGEKEEMNRGMGEAPEDMERKQDKQEEGVKVLSYVAAHRLTEMGYCKL